MDARLRQLNDGVLAALLFVAPLILGGRHPLGRLAVAALATLLGLGLVVRWTLGRQSTWVPVLLGPAVAWSAVLLVAWQLVPLPSVLLTRLVPGFADLLPMWVDGGPAGSWRTISMDPTSTRQALAMAAAYGLLFFAAVQQMESLRDIERWLRWIALAGIGMAVIGIVQHLSDADKFLWVYEHPTRGPQGTTTGPFANRNHFAHFLVLALGPMIYQLCVPRRRSSSRDSALVAILWGVGLTVTLLAILLSRSRGGFIACGVTLATAACYLAACGLVTRRGLWISGVLGGLLVSALAIHGGEHLKERLVEASRARSLADFSPERADLWSAHLAALPGSPWFGYGAATHLHVYRTFMPRHYEVQFTHGESGYMPLLLETGVFGICILAAAFLSAGYWLVRASRDRALRPLAGAIAPALAASIAHSIGDFVWYIPACLTVTLLLLACLACLSRLAGTAADPAEQPARVAQSRSRSRSAAGRGSARPGFSASQHFPTLFRPLSAAPYASVIVATMVSLFALPNLVDDARAAGAADRARHLARQHNSSDAGSRRANHQLCYELHAVTTANPTDARAHVQLAQALIAEANARRAAEGQPPAFLPNGFDGLSAEQVRDYLADEYELLKTAAAHTRRALACCPLEGDAYVLWCDLRHLSRSPEASTEQWLSQAARVRPHSGAVLLRRGQQWALEGDLPQAIAAWSEAFREHPQLRGALVERLWPTLPQSILLEIFNPDADGLLSVYYQLNRMGRYDNAKALAPSVAAALAAEAAEQRDDHLAADALNRASRLAAEGEQLGRAIEYAQLSQLRVSSDVDQRLWLAELLKRDGRFAAAGEQLEWVLRRKPRDATVRAQLIRMRTAAATPPQNELR